MSTNNDRKWNPICGDGWGVREAMVIINVYFNDRNTFFQLLLDYENLRYLFFISGGVSRARLALCTSRNPNRHVQSNTVFERKHIKNRYGINH